MNKLTFLLAVSVFYGVFAHAQNYTETFQKVLVKETYVHNVITESVFAQATEQVLVRQPYNVGATFVESVAQVLRSESTKALVVIPAEFAEIIDTIVVREACGTAPAIVRTYIREVLTVPEIVREYEIYATYETITLYAVLQNGTGSFVPAEYVTIPRTVLLSPPYATQTDVPPTLELFTIKKCSPPSK